MKIILLIGNGFDKAQGLNTCYSDFYNSYKNVAPSSSLEERVQKDIRSDYETWADMEEALGNYSAKFENVNDFMSVLQILNGRLKDYLISESQRIESLDLSKQVLLSDLIHPERFLELKQLAAYSDLLPSKRDEIIDINCISLNYTYTFESLLERQNAHLGFLRHSDNPVYFRNMIHLHGTLDDMILLGVNDSSQIANEGFRSSNLLIEEFVKPEINNGCENMRNERVLSLIREADVIVLFGVSVGVTDSIWWHSIGEVIDNPYRNLHLIYYPFDPNLDTTGHPNSKLRWSKDFIAILRERMGIQQSVEQLRDIIYVGINKPFLNLRGI